MSCARSWLLLLCVASCAEHTGPVASFVVEATAGQQTLESTPWPSDLFLDDTGHVGLAALPGIAPALATKLLRDLNQDQDGFGVSTGIYFPFEGSIEPASLAGHAHLFDLDSGDEVPVETYLRAHDRPARILVRPARGVVLREHAHYAAVLTRAIEGTQGALGPSSDLAAILDGEAASVPRLSRAATSYAPLLARLDLRGPMRSDIAAATVFTTHSITRTLEAARTVARSRSPIVTVQRVWARDPTGNDDGSLDALFGTPALEQPGLDNPGGIAHGQLDFVVQGTLTAPDYLNDLAARTPLGGTPTHVALFDDIDGVAKPRGTVTIPFSFAIPRGANLSALPVTMFQYGLDGDASSMSGVANSYAAAGIATFTIDIPFHGGRDPTCSDGSHSYGGAPGPDEWAEVHDLPSVSFFDVSGDASSDVAPMEPKAIRSAFLQAAADLLSVVQLLEHGDLAAIGVKEPRLASLKLATEKLSFTGISFGAIIGAMTLAIEPDLGAASLDVGGGGLLGELLLHSAVYGPLFGTILDNQLGTTALSSITDPPDTDFAFQLVAYLLEAGDPLAYAPYVARSPLPGSSARHVLFTSAHFDELVPNAANVALAIALGLTPVDLPNGAAADLSPWPGGMRALPPISANGPGGVTSAFVQYETATHGMMYYRKATRRYDLVQPFPYPAFPAPVDVDNPIDRVHALVVDFISQYQRGEKPIVKAAQ